MKKILSLLIITVLITAGCSATRQSELQKKSAGIAFEYEATTRGAYKKVIVSPDSITTVKDRDMKNVVARKLKAKEWKQLVEAYDLIKNVPAMGDLKAPSNKSNYDGAMMANLKIIVAGQQNTSSTFDHGNPPAEIKALTDKIIELSDLNKQ
jgi:hypothetical protein